MRNTITRTLVGLLFIATAACGGGDDEGGSAPEFDTYQEFSYVVADVACDINEKCDTLPEGKTVAQCKSESRSAIDMFCGNEAYKQYCEMAVDDTNREKLLDCYDASKAAECGSTEVPEACKAIGMMPGT
jgi:hypothetical protein